MENVLNIQDIYYVETRHLSVFVTALSELLDGAIDVLSLLVQTVLQPTQAGATVMAISVLNHSSGVC